MSLIRTLLHFLVLAALLTLLVQTAVAQCPTVVWSESFDGEAVDDARWEIQEGDGCAIGLCGWGNEELQWYQSENAVVEDGMLHIIARRENAGGRAYTSARLRTQGKGEWTFGRFEARIRLPRGQGIWPAFWMMPTDPKYGGWPRSGEIDVMENVGHEPDRIHGTVHFGTGSSLSSALTLHNETFSDGFHEFAIERSPGSITWFVDGFAYHEVRESDVAPHTWPFDEPFHFLLNVAVGGRWPGSPDQTTIFPDTMSVDYVHAYDAPRARIEGPRRAVSGERAQYAVENAPDDASFSWSVPAGAHIESGQGTDRITVVWGDEGGSVEASVESMCGVQRLAVDVDGGSDFERVGVLAAFEGTDEVTVGGRTSGTFDVVANPDETGPNPSALSGRYRRNAALPYDVLYLESPVSLDADAFADGTLHFRMDVRSDAPVGTEIILQLENGALSASAPYPVGRHSRYHAETAEPGVWQRLQFEPLDRPDADLDASGVRSMVLLFAPNSHTGHTYLLDNFEVFGRDSVSGVGVPRPIHTNDAAFLVYPNPTSDYVRISYRLMRSSPVRLDVFDVTGRTVLRHLIPDQPIGDFESTLRLGHLPPGIYYLRAHLAEAVQTAPIVVIGN